MIETDILTINIEDLTTEATINAELTKEIIYKLYRIKEEKEYDTLFEYDKYNAFCDKMKDTIRKFINAIECDYDKEISKKIDETPSKNKSSYTKYMDYLISNGYDFSDATKKVFKDCE